MLDRARADALARTLDLDVDTLAICHACLLFVVPALEREDEREVRYAVRVVAPSLWEEGLEPAVRAALERAGERGERDAEAAIAEVEASGARSRTVAAIVRRLAEDLLARLESLAVANGSGGAPTGIWPATPAQRALAGRDLSGPALEYARNLGGNFPFLRPAGHAFEAFADRAARDLLGVDGKVPPERLAEGVALVDQFDRRRLVQEYARGFPGVWESLCRDLGRATAEQELVESAVRAAVDERREPAPVLVGMLEDRRVPELPYHVLACVLAHDDVWSLADAVAAAEAAAPARLLPGAWVEAIARVAHARLERVHRERVRTLAGRLAGFLPFEPFPHASARLQRACWLVASDDWTATAVAVSLLRNYVAYLTGPPGPSPN